MIRIVSSIILLCFCCIGVYAQEEKEIIDPYKVNHYLEMPLTGVGFGLSVLGYNVLREESRLSTDVVMGLDANDINRFDRPALNFPSSKYGVSATRSDRILNATLALPALLLLDRNIRHNWKDFITLYFQSHLAGSSLYLSMAYPIKRARPFVYNTSLSIEMRTGVNTGNSFFSGHTASTATATFFMVKVMSDYGYFSNTTQRVIAYGLASIPPAIVGYYRIAAGKHFRSDIMVGYAVGVLTGVLVPHLHKKKDRKLSAIPVYNAQQKGVYVQYRW